MKIKVIQWNISYSCKIDKIIEYLKSHIEKETIICLQEVLSSFKERLIEKLEPDDYSYSLDYRKPGVFDGKTEKWVYLHSCLFTNTELHLLNF